MASDLAAELSKQVALVVPPLLEYDYSSYYNIVSGNESEGEESADTVETPPAFSQVLTFI